MQRMSKRFVDADFRREVALPDGLRVRLRLLKPADRDKLAEAITRLSPESRYLRFLSATTQLSPDALRYLTELDNENHLAIVATTATAREDDEEGLGIARFVRADPKSTSAEAAVTVADAYHGRGLGKLLLAALTLAARERGIERFTAEILKENGPILALLGQLGANVQEREEGGVVYVDLPLPGLQVEEQLQKPSDGPGAALLRFANEELKLLRRVLREARQRKDGE